jgi:hypothetical protein
MKKILQKTKKMLMKNKDLENKKTIEIIDSFPEKQSRPLSFAITSAPSLFSADFTERNKLPS